MENKQLTTQESLDLITKMIDNTRRNFNAKGGLTMMLWGYASVAVSIAVYLCVRFTLNPLFFWLWFALPAIGWPLNLMLNPKKKAVVRTYMDRIVDYIWLVFSVTCAAIVIAYCVGPLLVGKPMLNILLAICVTMSMSVAMTGLVVKFRPLAVSGFAGIILSMLLPAFGWLEQTLGIGIIFLIVMAIPGTMLYRAEKKQKI